MKSKKEIVLTVAYLIGVSDDILKTRYLDTDSTISKISELRKDEDATILRCLSKIRSAFFLNFKNIDMEMKNNIGHNIDKLPQYIDNSDISYLESHNCPIVEANCSASKYVTNISLKIDSYISKLNRLFPEWLNFSYIKGLFVVPKKTQTFFKSEFVKYISNRSLYPFQMYIHWEPIECGNLLSVDNKFLRVLYDFNGDTFNEGSKCIDADDDVKDAIYDFIDASNKINMVVDCENVNPYKLYGVLQNLDSESLSKISKLVLWDDAQTSYAWKIFKNFVDIEVEYNKVDRIVENKSLVDHKLVAGVCKEFYANGVDSFILVSSDSDFWGLISSLDDAKFLVMYEYDKCSYVVKDTLNSHNIFSCAIDDFCTGNAESLKKHVLLGYLKENISLIFEMSGYDLAKKVHYDNYIEVSESDIKLFYEKYIKTIRLSISKDNSACLIIKD